MFGKMTRGWARKRYVKEAKELVDHLQELDDESIGLVLAIAVHHRNILISEGAAMRDLTQLVKDAPMYQHDVAKAVGILARKKRLHDALGLQVWVHSLRAVADSSLYTQAVQVWRELKRGQPHVAKARKLVKKETGFELDISMANEMPSEFAEED